MLAIITGHKTAMRVYKFVQQHSADERVYCRHIGRENSEVYEITAVCKNENENEVLCDWSEAIQDLIGKENFTIEIR